MPEPDNQLWQKAHRWLQSRAQTIAVDPAKLKSLVKKAIDKVRTQSPALGNMMEEMHTLLRMLNARATGRYPHTPIKSIVAATVGVLYFVMPFDFIPDFIPGLGLTDDLAVLAFLLKMIANDLNAFRQWERDHGDPSAGLPRIE